MAEKVSLIIIRSDGKRFTIGEGEGWRIPSDGLENWANLGYEVSSQELPAYDGAIVTSKRVSSIDRTVTCVCSAADKDKRRADAIAFFNPKYTFEAHLTYKGRTRWCKGEQIGFKASEGNIYQPVEITWTILCANPFMQSEDDFGKDIAEVVGYIGFPWVSFLPQEYGSKPGTNDYAVASVHSFNQSVEITNDGDVASGLRLEIGSTGHVVNPMVRLGDGWIRVYAELYSGDVIKVDASSRPPTITLNGENAMHMVDRKSNILNMMIQPGDTTIQYDADDGERNMSVRVFYNKQYLGV